MSRIMTAERRQQIATARVTDPNALGPILGELVVEGNVPVEAVATLMDVSDVTIYRWMYGVVSPREATKVRRLKNLITVLRKAKRARDLPLGGTIKERIRQVDRLILAHRPTPRA